MGVSAKRSARIDLTANAAGVKPGVDEARRQLRTFQREQAKSAKAEERAAKKKKKDDEKARAKAMGHANSLADSMASGAGMALGMDAAGGISGMASGVVDLERELTRFQIISGKTPEQMAAIRAALLQMSTASGLAAKDILGGVQTYVDLTGDVDGATAAMGAFTHIAQASGSSIQDVATAAAAMQDATKLDPKDFESTFSGLISQGKAGAVNLKDMAGELSSLLPKFVQFKGMLGRGAIQQLGAAFQVVRHGVGDASEASTDLEALMGSLATHADHFEDANVKIFDKAKDGTKTFRNLHDIVLDISKSKLAKDPEALSKAFGRKEGLEAYNQLKRLPDLYDQMIKAGEDNTAVTKDFDTYVNSAAGRMERSWERVKNTIANALTPERVEKFASALEHAAGFVENSVGAIDHFVNGPSKDQRGDDVARKLVEQANTLDSNGESKGNEADAIDRAKQLVAGDKDQRKALAIGMNAVANPLDVSDSDLEGVKQGALKFLKSEGIDTSSWSDIAGQRGTVSSTAGGILAGSGGVDTAALARMIGAEVAKAMAALPAPTVKVGAEPVQKAAANSKGHRRGQY